MLHVPAIGSTTQRHIYNLSSQSSETSDFKDVLWNFQLNFLKQWWIFYHNIGFNACEPIQVCSLSPLGPIYILRLGCHCDNAASSLPNLIYCFGVVLLHLATVISLRCHWGIALWAIQQQRRSNIADASLSLDVNGLLPGHPVIRLHESPSRQSHSLSHLFPQNPSGHPV